MARTTVIQNQLTAGELSPRMQGRFDLEQYYQGAKTLADMLPLPHGGATGRPGTRFVAAVGDSTIAARLIPFVFKTSDAYVIEMQDQKLRFYRAQGQVQETAQNITGATQANPVVVTITSHGYSDGDEVYITDVGGMTEINGRWFTVANQTANTFELSGEDGTGHTAYTSGGTAAKVYEIASPWATADLFQIQFVQDADTMYLVHPSYKPRTLTRSGHTSWTLANYAPTADPFTSATNYPAAVALFEQRIVFGYTETNPQRLWFSKSADIQNMTTGTLDADGFTKDIYARQANPIRWVVGSDDLVVGTTGGVWVVERPASGAVTVSNFSIKRHVTTGSADLAPIEVDNQALYMSRRGQASNPGEKLRRFKYDEAEADYVAPDLTLLAEHATDGGIVDMTWQQDGWRGAYEGTDLPAADRLLWAIRSDGVLLSFTFNPEERVIAWARHRPPNGAFESVAAMPGASGDEVWVVVNRTVNGATLRTVEFLDPDLFMDGALTGTADPATKTWSGLGHLEGETVAVLADGAPVADLTVIDGAITLTAVASSLMAGLAYTPEVELMPLEAPLQDGQSVGARKSVAAVVIRFLTTVGAKVTASDRTTGDEIPFRQVSDPVEDPVPPFTGDKEIIPPASWQDPIVKITQPNSLPITVQAVAVEFEAHR